MKLYRVEITRTMTVYAMAESASEALDCWKEAERNELHDDPPEVSAREVMPGHVRAPGWDDRCLVYGVPDVNIKLGDVWPKESA